MKSHNYLYGYPASKRVENILSFLKLTWNKCIASRCCSMPWCHSELIYKPFYLTKIQTCLNLIYSPKFQIIINLSYFCSLDLICHMARLLFATWQTFYLCVAFFYHHEFGNYYGLWPSPPHDFDYYHQDLQMQVGLVPWQCRHLDVNG